jgi:hypothetical protein
VLAVLAKLDDELGDTLIDVRAMVVDVVIELVAMVFVTVIDEVTGCAPQSPRS